MTLIQHVATLCVWTPIVAISAWSSLSLISLIRNIRIARSVGLPYLVGPVSSTNIPWLICQPLFRKLFRFRAPDGVQLCILTWSIDHRHRMHEKHGLAFLHVTPGDIKFYTCAAGACKRILAGKGITRPRDMIKIFEVFGPNIFTTDGEEWANHKKIAAPPLNERNSELVWKSALGSITTLMRTYSFNDQPIMISDDLNNLTMEVFSVAGFGIGDINAIPPGYTHSLAKCLRIVVAKIAEIGVVAPWLLPKDTRAAVHDMVLYMKTTAEAEKRAIAEGTATADGEKGTLLAALIRESEMHKGHQDTVKQGKTRPFTDLEIYGNMFTLYLAGHETTANAIRHSIYHLSVNPEMQNWMREEIREVVGKCGWNYTAAFPELVRTLAVMYETLRLYSALDWIARESQVPVTFDFTDVAHIDPRMPSQAVIPPGILTFAITSHLQTLPAYWGSNSLEWNPRRWVKLNEKSHEVIESPAPKDTFFAWSGGLHPCIGKKFSQVEFVVVMARILLEHRIEAVPLQGEEPAETKRRVEACVEDMFHGPVRQMGEPQRILFKFRTLEF